MKGTILYIEDDLKIQNAVKTFLENQGYTLYCSNNAKNGIELIQQHHFHLILLDLSLPDFSGEECCEWIKVHTQIPVIIISANVSEEIVVKAFQLGADDYIRKPFGLREMLARIESILSKNPQKNLLSFNQKHLIIDLTQHQAFLKQKPLHLTKNEYQILKLFTTHPYRTFTRSQLIEGAFGYEYDGYERTIDSHIKNLRLKLNDPPANPLYIHTIHRVGYQFKAEADYEKK